MPTPIINSSFKLLKATLRIKQLKEERDFLKHQYVELEKKCIKYEDQLIRAGLIGR
jgi:hypothetical protein